MIRQSGDGMGLYIAMGTCLLWYARGMAAGNGGSMVGAIAMGICLLWSTMTELWLGTCTVRCIAMETCLQSTILLVVGLGAGVAPSIATAIGRPVSRFMARLTGTYT